MSKQQLELFSASANKSTNHSAPMLRMALIQFFLMVTDLAITIFVDDLRHVRVNFISVYLVQYILLATNTILLFIRFTHTFPFRAGMVSIMTKEFEGHLVAILVYHVAFFACRAVGVVNMLRCQDARCNPWVDQYKALYIFYRAAAIPQYYAFKTAIIRLCESKYYKDSPWLRHKMRGAA
ncbi:transmembrane protein 138-domain-containing protein [Chytriomyces cf. hyalinus JEL632]|nr:transmembrane protein 138-domain-containing protein [Chytriomyces cf. hyalinus JEL632]